MRKSESLSIMVIGPLWPGGTCLQRMQALQDLGCKITPFDTTPYLRAGTHVGRSLAHRLSWGGSLSKLNSDLARETVDKHCDWVWIEKGTWIYPQTLSLLKDHTGALLVHYTPDAAFLVNRTRHFVGSVPHYDVMITSKGWEVDLYHKHGARKTVLLPQGFDRSIFRPWRVSTDEYERLRSRVCFVGRYESHYHQLIRKLAKCVPRGDLAVWGGWRRRTAFSHGLRRVVRGRGIWLSDYAKALCCSEIGLGLLSKLMPETSTTRTFEIPACGTFMLAERTEEHQTFFEEGVEAEFFASTEELIDKTAYYLVHPAERKRIADAGRQRCIASGYSYHDRMQHLIRVMDE